MYGSRFWGGITDCEHGLRYVAAVSLVNAHVGVRKMKTKIIFTLLMLAAGSVWGAETNATAVCIPQGVVAASPAQKTFIKALAELPLGASRETVRQALGTPAQTNAIAWLYDLKEDRIEGGYYITASLTFATIGLACGTVEFGHVTMGRKDEE
jgi:hypothetical protein